MQSCRICNNKQGNKIHTAREMYFGLQEEFDYLECAECGCLQIINIPKDVSKYYPPDYHPHNKVVKLKDHYIKSILKIQMANYCLHGKKYIVGWLLSKIFDCGFLAKIKNIGLDFNKQILDVGAGSGKTLVYLRRHGFTNLTGLDPYINKNIIFENGIKIYKKDLFEINRQYEFILLNHSFEHMPDPYSVLKKLYQLLVPGNYVLIRIPVADSYSWKKYNVNWISLDPPRHFYLHTTKSMKILAQKSGFRLTSVLYDSIDKQIWGSEQCIRNIPFRDNRSYFENPKNSIFTKKQIKEFKAKTIELNKNNEGDAACFYLYKPSDLNL